VRDAVPPAVTTFLEALDTDAEHQDHSWVANTRTDILAGNATAVEAAASYLRERDYEVVVDRRPLVGEAAERGRQLGAIATSMRPAGLGAMVVGGETTVTVRGTGRGGRNQELALAAATAIADRGPVVLLAGGTDGIDGASEHAGAVVDPGTVSRLRAAGFDPEQVLADNDSGAALAAVGDAIVTGPTGTNVCDVTMVLSAS